MLKPILAFAAAAMVAAVAVAATRHDLAEDKALQPAGKPIACVTQSQVRDTRVLDDSTIDFFLAGRRVYRNHLPAPCPELKAEDSFTHSTPVNDYCSGDPITVFRRDTPGFPGATCPLGPFQPMTGPAHVH